MTDEDNRWGLSNPGPGTFFVWLEPWAEEFEVPARSTVILLPAQGRDLGEVEWTPDNIVIWANGPTVRVFIDDRLQDSGSAIIPIPEGLTKDMLSIVFAGQPSARLGGAFVSVVEQPSLWQRLKRCFRL